MKKSLVVILLVSIIISSLSIIPISMAAISSNYLVFGDSIAAGYGLEESGNVNTLSNNYVAGKDSNAYCGIIARDFGMNLTNLAKSGATSTDLVNLLSNNWAVNQIKNADLITISIGGNDLIGMVTQVLLTASIYEFMHSWGLPASRTTADIEKMYTKLEENLTSIMTTITSNSKSRAIIMLQSLYNPYKASPTYAIKYGNNSYPVGYLIDYYIDRVNEIYRKVQEKVGGFVICETAAAMNNDFKCFHEADNPDFHPTNYGHKVIANTIKNTYRDVTSTTKPTEQSTTLITVPTTETTTTLATKEPILDESDLLESSQYTDIVITEITNTTVATTAEQTTVTEATTTTEATTVTEVTTTTEATTITDATTITEVTTATEITTTAQTTLTDVSTIIETSSILSTSIANTESTTSQANNSGCKSAICSTGLIFIAIITIFTANLCKKERN